MRLCNLYFKMNKTSVVFHWSFSNYDIVPSRADKLTAELQNALGVLELEAKGLFGYHTWWES